VARRRIQLEKPYTQQLIKLAPISIDLLELAFVGVDLSIRAVVWMEPHWKRFEQG
jgi:hypothetical protein